VARHLTSQGIFNGGKRPFGFDIVEDARSSAWSRTLTRMAVIERMKSMRENGASFREIGAVTGHGPKSVQRMLERMDRALGGSNAGRGDVANGSGAAGPQSRRRGRGGYRRHWGTLIEERLKPALSNRASNTSNKRSSRLMSGRRRHLASVMPALSRAKRTPGARVFQAVFIIFSPS
jgi:hypothetical protein